MNQSSSYVGADNLEVMTDAINYNAYLRELVLKHVDRSAPVLDAGAGIGTFTSAMRDKGIDVRAFEPDPQQSADIRDKGIECHDDINAISSGSMGSIYSLNVLEHIDDDVAALRDWGRVLTSGGRLVLYVPAFQVLFSDMDRKVGHFRRYSRASLVAKVEAAGYEVIASRYVDSIGFLATLVYKALARPGGAINRRSLVIYDRVFFPVSVLCDLLANRFFGKNVLVVARKA